MVRIFTPEHEVPFAEHPCVGTSYIIAKRSCQIGSGFGLDQPDTLLPIQEISTGFPYIVISLKNRSALDKLTLDYASLRRCFFNIAFGIDYFNTCGS